MASKWAMGNWQSGKPSLLQAFGYKGKATLNPGAATAKYTGALVQSGAAQSSSKGFDNTSAPTASGPCNAAQTSANKRIVQGVAAKYGWGSGTQWSALNNIIMNESGYCNTIQNSSSTAYGIGQFLSTTWATVGGQKTSDPTQQATYMMEYIKQRYTNPVNAWSFHTANGYY